jgi:serine/threonine protein kinase
MLKMSRSHFNQEDRELIVKTIEDMKITDHFARCESFEIYRSPSGGFYVVPIEEGVDQGASNSRVMKAYRIEQIDPLEMHSNAFLLKATKLGDKNHKIEELEENFLRESSALQASISAENRDKVESFQIEKDDSQMAYLSMEFFSGKTLFKLSEKFDLTDSTIPYHFPIQDLTMEEKLNLTDQIAESLYYLHCAGYCHGDVSYGNILLNEKRAVLIDFGTARYLGSEDKLLDIGVVEGTPGYLAPEVFQKKKSIPGDYYSFGGVLASFFSDGKNNPFQDKFKFVRKTNEKKVLAKEAKKYELYVAQSFADIDLKALNKEDAIIVYKNEDNYEAVFARNGKLEVFSNYTYEVHEEKPLLQKDDSFAIYFTPKPGVTFFSEGKEVQLSEESQNKILKKVAGYSFAKAKQELLNSESLVKNQLKEILVKENKARINVVNLSLDFSGEIDMENEIFALTTPQKKIVKDSKNIDMMEYIKKQALFLKPVNLRMGQDVEGVECRGLYNLDGFFKGEKYEPWLWLKPDFENYLLRLQENSPGARPTALENRLFFGALHYLGNDEKLLRPILPMISKKSFKDEEKDEDFKMFRELATDFFEQVRVHPLWRAERLKEFFTITQQFLLNKNLKLSPDNQLINLIYLTSVRMHDLQKIIPESLQQCYGHYKKFNSQPDLFVEYLRKSVRLPKPVHEMKQWGGKGEQLWKIQMYLINERKSVETQVLSPTKDISNINAFNKLEMIDTFLEIFANITKENCKEKVKELYAAVEEANKVISTGKLKHEKMGFFKKTTWSVTTHLTEALENHFIAEIKPKK